jgi:pyruvate/2-oxoglutarate dehydrogenase complex dihydrolipoamide dehydrogenase (E3) component
MPEHYDVIIVGSGAGGGTLAPDARPLGKTKGPGEIPSMSRSE